MKNCAKSNDSTSCRGGRLERPRYFPRQLITPTEMNLGQDYFRARLRLHNRMLHGWGVVCGALVCPVRKADGSGCEPWQVKVERGYVLGPYGDEILIDTERTIDLRTCGLSGAPGEPAAQAEDPWCSEVYVPRKPDVPLCVAVRYEELMTQPVRAQPTGCGCDDTACEYSRWRDGYVIGVLDECRAEPPERDHLLERPNPPCPACPTDPWVVLAEVEIDEKGTIQKIDNCSCRRLVVSASDLWWRCDPGPFSVSDVTIKDSNDAVLTEAAKPGDELKVEVKGEGLDKVLRADLGDGISTWIKTYRPELLKLRAKVQGDASDGQHDLTVIDAAGREVQVRVLQIDAPSSLAPPSGAPKGKPKAEATAASRTRGSRSAAKKTREKE